MSVCVRGEGGGVVEREEREMGEGGGGRVRGKGIECQYAQISTVRVSREVELCVCMCVFET